MKNQKHITHLQACKWFFQFMQEKERKKLYCTFPSSQAVGINYICEDKQWYCKFKTQQVVFSTWKGEGRKRYCTFVMLQSGFYYSHRWRKNRYCTLEVFLTYTNEKKINDIVHLQPCKWFFFSHRWRKKMILHT